MGAQAAEHLTAAETILRERDARNELGKVWVAQACGAQPTARVSNFLIRTSKIAVRAPGHSPGSPCG